MPAELPYDHVATDSGLKPILYLSLIFFLPLLVSYGVYINAGKLGLNTKNNGVLIDPDLRLNQFEFETMQGQAIQAGAFIGKWQLVLYSDKSCAEQCRGQLLKLLQIRQALGKAHKNIRLVLVLGRNTSGANLNLPENSYGLLQVVKLKPGSQSLQHSVMAKIDTTSPAAVLITDPSSRLVLGYSEDFTQQAVYDDMRWLIKANIRMKP